MALRLFWVEKVPMWITTAISIEKFRNQFKIFFHLLIYNVAGQTNHLLFCEGFLIYAGITDVNWDKM